MADGTLLYAQSGGVTAVINATAAAVIETARARGVKVLAGRNGILGVLREELIDTSKESAAAIRALAQTPGGIVSRDELVDRSRAAVNARSIDVQVNRLRRKIEADPRTPRYLQTVRGSGYVLRPD